MFKKSKYWPHLLIVFFCFCVISVNEAQEVAPKTLMSNIQEKLFKVKNSEGTPTNVYVDLNRQSYTQIGTGKFNNDREEEFINFKFKVIEGSFINKGQPEYLLFIYLDSMAISFFSHAENYGNTTMMYIFDRDYIQISDVVFADFYTRFVEAVDIDGDGINEIITKSEYGMDGCKWEQLRIYYKGNQKSIFNLTVSANCDNRGSQGEYVNLTSSYSIEKSSIVFNSILETYMCFGWIKKNDEIEDIDNRFLKSEVKKDIYKYNSGTFTHIKDVDNVNWDIIER